jgi:membrane-bound lytic murein transglycosylase C
MQTESSFNPYAVSHADALGLMQVVQHSAGKDVFRCRENWPAEPQLSVRPGQ